MSSLEDQIISTIRKWEPQHPGDLSENNDAILERLMTLTVSCPSEGAEPVNKKAKLAYDSKAGGGADSTGGGKTPKTAMDLALYTAKHCEEKDLKELRIFSKDSPLGESFETRDAFVEAIGEKGVLFFHFHSRVYGESPAKLQEDYNVIRSLLVPKKRLQAALNDLFGRKEEGNIPNLVSRSTQTPVGFPPDPRKSYAYVVTGESGSGKTWFVTQSLRRQNNLAEASFIYKEIDDDDVKKVRGMRSCQKEAISDVYREVLRELYMKDGPDGAIYNFIAEMSRKHNQKRNTSATECLKELIAKSLQRNGDAIDWWNNPSVRLDQLVIIIDEVGRLPDLGRGLVDEVRIITETYRATHAEKVMLVLVGSGLDGLIRQDSIPTHLLDLGSQSQDSEDEDFEQSFLSFGTDPMKSQLISLQSPSLKNKEDISGIPVKAIELGTYSKVLATNTRMLFRGIIPVMADPSHRMNIDANELTSRLVELGSTNIVMDFAARAYIDLNGLGRIKAQNPGKLKRLLLKHFVLLRRAEFTTDLIKANPAVSDALSEADEMVNVSDYVISLQLGIITADITSTSAALRYLACEGHTAPLDATNGIGFETVLQHHLYRLSRARHDLLPANSATNGPSSYFCGRYSLKRAWPPSATKKDAELGTQESMEKEVKNRMKSRNYGVADATAIAELVNPFDEYDLVMRQTVSNAQGADVMVLSKRIDENEASLDLYQAKHYKNIPGAKSKGVVKAFASLGVAYDDSSLSFTATPDTGSAGYSYLGTLKFVKVLVSKLGYGVEIRDRVVVYSGTWKSMASKWEEFPFDEAKKSRLRVWTRELLEPTISALEISEKSYEYDSDDEDDDDDERLSSTTKSG